MAARDKQVLLPTRTPSHQVQPESTGRMEEYSPSHQFQPERLKAPGEWRNTVELGHLTDADQIEFTNGGKRANDRRASLLRKSAELSDFIKKSRTLQRQTMSSNTGTGNASRNPPRSGAASPASGTQAWRGDLFGQQDLSHSTPGGLRIRDNTIFERTPPNARLGSQQSGVRSQVPGPGSAARLPLTMTSVGAGLRLPLPDPPKDPDPPDPQNSQGSPLQDQQRNGAHQGTTSGTGNPSNTGSKTSSWFDRLGEANLQNSDQDMLSDEEGEDSSDNDNVSISSLDETKANDDKYMEERHWRRSVMKEVSRAYTLLLEQTGIPTGEEVVVEHVLNFDAQVRIQARKRRLEDCGVVFCTVDLSPSRDSFQQWVYQEVENNAAVQAVHVKVLAARHYLVIFNSMVDGDAVLAGGPYYMRKRMIYNVPWEPGFDTKKVLAKKLACWLDLLEVDPMLEGESDNLLASLGQVMRTAGTTVSQDGKFQNVRGCVLMDMTKPLPTNIHVKLNRITKKIAIRYDLLPDTCFTCHERGHFARICPLTSKTKAQEPAEGIQETEEDFVPVNGKGKRPASPDLQPQVPAQPANIYEVLANLEDEQITKNPETSTSADINKSIEGEKTNDPTGADKSSTEEENQEKISQVAEEETSARPLPDLNATPNLLSEQHQSQLSRKEKKKARKKEMRRKKA
ncbi:hypothetical protein R1sor_016723 [Riccia sorocarpa]|uniref:CCHC-type domain-containing protein n=1 Tax=Riccia sorocarpa TaxID=122646 RepID=A0ABD3HJU2_9MARC